MHPLLLDQWCSVLSALISQTNHLNLVITLSITNLTASNPYKTFETLFFFDFQCKPIRLPDYAYLINIFLKFLFLAKVSVIFDMCTVYQTEFSNVCTIILYDTSFC